MGSPEKVGNNTSESILPSRIPELNIDRLPIDGLLFAIVIDPGSRNGFFPELVIMNSEDNRGLPD